MFTIGKSSVGRSQEILVTSFVWMQWRSRFRITTLQKGSFIIRTVEFKCTCVDYIEFLNHHKFQISMSKPATPKENAYIESFFKTLKTEEIYFKSYKTMRDVIINLPKFIDEVYNEKRLHSSLGYRTPSEYENAVLNTNPADRPVMKLWGQAVWWWGRSPSVLF